MHQDLGTLVDHVWKAEDFVPIVHMLTWTSDHHIDVKKNIVLLQKIPALPELLVHLDDEHFGPPAALPKKIKVNDKAILKRLMINIHTATQKFVRATSPFRFDSFESITRPCFVRSFPYF